MVEEQIPRAAKTAREMMKDEILADYPRLGTKDAFQFKCHPGVSCFNKCCADVNIFLTPYDVLRLKKRLGITSTEFLDKYAILPFQKEMNVPAVVLRMGDNEDKSCQFVSPEGCGVYSDRPWPCRMYPLGLATQKDTPDGWQGDRFYFLMKDEMCKGHFEDRQLPISQYVEEQGLDEYDEWGEAFKELTLHPFFEDGGVLSPEKMHMLFVACYDIDKFREFVFESTLLERFDVDEDFVHEMKASDEALLRFSFLWLRFSLFGENTMKPRPEAVEHIEGKRQRQKTQ